MIRKTQESNIVTGVVTLELCEWFFGVKIREKPSTTVTKSIG